MADLQNAAIYGDDYGIRTLGANMVNPTMADGSTDWGAILANGIRGAAQGAIASQVQGAYASGQLVYPQQAGAQGGNLMPLLVIGVVLYMVLK
jgi:hypothetical protein